MKRRIPLEKRDQRWLKKEAWRVFSAWVRKRDPMCFTCENKTENGGHWRHGHTKVGFFDEKNVHGQCSRCNLYLSGNGTVYSLKMAKIHGVEKAEEMWKEFSKDHFWGRKELILIIEKYENNV
jgi:hypothetical protein